MAIWKCSVCKFVYEGVAPPEKCPRCGAPREKFEELKKESADLVFRARLTNNLHMEIASKLEEIKALAEKGIQDALDPACVAIFKKEKEDAEATIQFTKAEIEVHVGKGKWG
ncbi:MAG: rubredoxin [Euryarchaeota archaeon]|nr:rubredoxin [Euryarchaeota archaeon]